MLRIGEEAFVGVLQQLAEEQLGRQVLQVDLAGFQALQDVVLRRRLQLGERLALVGLAPAFQGGDADPVDVAWHQLQLMAELRRGVGDERPLHVPECAVPVGGFHLSVDELRHPGLDGAGAVVVAGDQSRHRGVDESPFGVGEEARLVAFAGFVLLGGGRLHGMADAIAGQGHRRDHGQGLAQEVAAAVDGLVIGHGGVLSGSSRFRLSDND